MDLKEKRHFFDSMDCLVSKTTQWFDDKGLINPDNMRAQHAKMTEEVQEVGEEVEKNDKDALDLEIGDVIVTCIGLAAQNGSSARKCLSLAYNKIKKRTGIVQNGTFIKDAP